MGLVQTLSVLRMECSEEVGSIYGWSTAIGSGWGGKGVVEGATQSADAGVQTRQLNVVKGDTKGVAEGGNESALVGVQTGQVNVVEDSTEGAAKGGIEGESDRVQTSLIQQLH